MSCLHRILLIGAGGREHALAWKLGQSDAVETVFVVPGNAGTALAPENICNIEGVLQDDFSDFLSCARKYNINFVLPTQESHFAAGIHDFFSQNGIMCLGPSKPAAELKTSKIFAKEFMLRHYFPTPKYWSFDDFDMARSFLQSYGPEKLVIKASGLTSGKGVIVTDDKESAIKEARKILVEGKYSEGQYCGPLLVEEYQAGAELSVVALTDGINLLMFPPIKDYKRREDHDRGPNTGGMGCCAPEDFCSKELLNEIEIEVLQAVIDGMRSEVSGNTFTGIICADIVFGKDGATILDFDTRFGDAGTQTYLPLLHEDADLMGALLACVHGGLAIVPWRMKSGYCVTVVAATETYPERVYSEGQISLGKTSEDVTCFFAGAKLREGVIVALGGRVLAVSAVAKSSAAAATKAYQYIQQIQFPKMYYRKDIGRSVRLAL